MENIMAHYGRQPVSSYAEYSQTNVAPPPLAGEGRRTEKVDKKDRKARKEKKEKKEKKDKDKKGRKEKKEKKKRHHRETTIMQTGGDAGRDAGGARIGEVLPRPSPVPSAGLDPVWNPMHGAPPTPEEVAALREQELNGIYSATNTIAPPRTTTAAGREMDPDDLLRRFLSSRDRQDTELDEVSRSLPPPEETIDCGMGSGTSPAGPTAMDLGKWREEELDRMAEIQYRVASGEEQQPMYYY